jgi:hypothetical protein
MNITPCANVFGQQATFCSHIGEMRNVYNILVGKPEGNRPLGRPRYRWEDNIRMYLCKIGWEGMDWMNLALDRDQCSALVSMVMKIEFHKRWGISSVAE